MITSDKYHYSLGCVYSEAALVDCVVVSKKHEKGRITVGDIGVGEESRVRDSLL